MLILLCVCSKSVDSLKYEIEDFPSLELEIFSNINNETEMEITIYASLLKFGYSLPKILFFMNEKIELAMYLPFSFLKFLKIEPFKSLNTAEKE